jgi:Holliday junction resolvasome RuvABC endonuclease subunit
MTTVIGCDPSLSGTGLVTWRDGRFFVSTVATPATMKREARHNHIAMSVLAMRDPTGPTLIVMEGRITPGADAIQTAMDLAELRGAINVAVHIVGGRQEICKVDVNPMTLKVYGTGNGRANKAAMQTAAIGRLGRHFRVSNADEADAAWLLALAMDHYGRPLCAMPAKNRTAVERPQWPQFTLEASP